MVQFSGGTLGGGAQRDKIAARTDHSLAAKMGDDRPLVILVRFAHALVLEELGVCAAASPPRPIISGASRASRGWRPPTKRIGAVWSSLRWHGP